MKVAGIQHDIVWENPTANTDRLGPQIAAAANAGAKFVALTEMYSVGFSMHAADLAEPESGFSTEFLLQQAATHRIHIAASIPTIDGSSGRPVNQLVVVDGTKDTPVVAARYNKIHPFTFAGEHEHYDAGQSFCQLTINGLRCSFFICYDLRFGDEFWQLGPDTDVFIVVANWPAARQNHWDTLLTARAIENQCYVLGVNRVGDDGNGLHYGGGSALIDPLGQRISSAHGDETMVIGDISAGRVSDVRARFPFLADRRS